MAEKIDVDRSIAGLADGGQRVTQLFNTQRGSRHGTQRASTVGGDYHGGGGANGHGGLDDRDLDTQQVENARVWPGAHVMRLQR
jgi:hypothetical protein